MDSELAVSSSMEARREKAVLQALAHFGGIEADREREPGMDWCDAVEGEELAAGDAVDVQCLRVEPAEDDAAEDPAARGGDDAA
jgi:hypothetical protein